MPLGQSRYGQYGYFDIPGAFSGYESALMNLMQSRKPGFTDFLGELGQMLQQLMEQKRQREVGEWERGMGERRLGVSEDYLGIAQEKLRLLQDQPPESPYGRPPWWTEGLTPEQVRGYQKKQVEPAPKEPKAPKLPAEWLKAPEKQRATIQKWVTDWKKYIFTSWKKRGEPENFEELSYIEKRAHFSEWARRIPVTLRAEVAKRVGLATPLGKLSKPPPKPSPEQAKGVPGYTQEQMDSYNACRDRGGTKEACKVEAGL